jgi:hypothetical protein
MARVSAKQLAADGVQTRGEAYYNYDVDGWIFPKGKKVPDYMELEHKRGRIRWTNLSWRQLCEFCGDS